MEVNDRGEVSGKPKGKIFIPPSLVDSTGNTLSTDKKQEMFERISKSEMNIKSDEDYQKEIDDVFTYNEGLRNRDLIKEHNLIKLNGNAILIRLFKHPPVRKVGSMYIPNKIVYSIQTEGGKTQMAESPLQYIHRGVIYNISDQCTDGFKKKFTLGDVVDLKLGLNLWQQRTWLKAEDFYEDKFDNYFIINENMIEKGVY